MQTKKQYTKGEEIFNSVTHGVGSLLSVIGTTVLVTLAAAYSDAGTVMIMLIYGLTLVILYTMSTLYHAFPFETVKKVFRILDHSSIYMLIAGTYTPFMLILLSGSTKGIIICAVVWAAALIGILLNAISIERFKKISMILYIALGWAVVFAIGDVVSSLPFTGLMLMLFGGISYTGGIVFYAQKKIKYMHSVWHLFVLLGSVLHYLCITLYVLPMSFVK